MYSFVAVCSVMSWPPGTTPYAIKLPISKLSWRMPQKMPEFRPRVATPLYRVSNEPCDVHSAAAPMPFSADANKKNGILILIKELMNTLRAGGDKP